MSAGVSMAAKWANGRLAGVLEGRKEEGSKSGKSREGANRNPKSKEYLSVLCIPFCTHISHVESWISEPSWELCRNGSLAPTLHRWSFLGRCGNLQLKGSFVYHCSHS